MNTDTEKQFVGNYIRLVNQVRSLQSDLQRMTEAFDNSTQLNNKLHDEIRLKDKMIEMMVNDLYNSYYDDSTTVLKIKYELDAQKQIVAEQNKKAADNASI